MSKFVIPVFPQGWRALLLLPRSSFHCHFVRALVVLSGNEAVKTVEESILTEIVNNFKVDSSKRHAYEEDDVPFLRSSADGDLERASSIDHDSLEWTSMINSEFGTPVAYLEFV
jgi:hypothetical protein